MLLLLTEVSNLVIIIFFRLNQSDDLNISENEIEKLAVDMEKELFNMCYTTDEEYKNKYQCLILSLKDPQNKVILCAFFLYLLHLNVVS